MGPTDAEIIAAGPWFQQIVFPSGLSVGCWLRGSSSAARIRPTCT
jgi:hypothetical protein